MSWKVIVLSNINENKEDLAHSALRKFYYELLHVNYAHLHANAWGKWNFVLFGISLQMQFAQCFFYDTEEQERRRVSLELP